MLESVKISQMLIFDEEFCDLAAKDEVYGMPQHEIMTIEEVAEYLRVSERTVYDWAQKGEIPCGKLGTSWRFKWSEIEQWVDDRLGTKNRRAAVQTIAIREVLAPNRVIMLDVDKKWDALNALIDVLAQAPQIRDREELAREIERREALMSTGIGCGIAVPHVRMTGIQDMIVAMGVCRQDIADYEAIDGQPVRIILMVAAGRDQHAQYLKTLAAASARLKDEVVRKRILDADTPQLIYDLMVGDA